MTAIGTLLEQQEDTPQSPLVRLFLARLNIGADFDTCQDRSSVLGLFLRKVRISFHELMFEALTRLYDDLTLYRDTCQTLHPTDSASLPQLNIPLSALEFETFIENEARNVEGRLFPN